MNQELNTTKIRITVDSVCNSLYLNHGFTYSSVGGLGYRFEIDHKDSEYAFECSLVPLPSRLVERDFYITSYYQSPINKDKLDNLVGFLDIPKNIRAIGTYLRKNHREIYNYICLTFQIRQGVFGKISDSNEMSTIAMKVLYENGLTNQTTNLLHRFTSNNNGYKSLV